MKEITVNVITSQLDKSNYNTKGMKIVLPLFFVILILLWIALIWNQGILVFVSTGVCFGALFALVIYMAVVSVRVSEAIKNRNFFIEKVAVAGKKFRPGNAEDLPVFYLIFEKYGKYWSTDNTDPDSVQIGDEYYVLICGKSKKTRFIYNAEKWQVSENDFIEENGVYKPAKRIRIREV